MAQEQVRRESHLIQAGSLGWIEGATLSSATGPTALCRYFGGLPYALPPVGPYRFRQARPLPDQYRYGTKNNPGRFSTKAAVCPQPGFMGAVDESLWDENCLQLNIYVPTGAPPREGWPVFFYIHGGFLQWGSPNMPPEALAPLFGETSFKAIMVAPAYRVNALGFLASRELQAEASLLNEPTGNQGFWDQRLALEWTAKHIAAFGGNADNISIGGYSAGSHSTFQQLAHELYFVPDNKAIIRRAIMWSNSSGVQPKTLSEQQIQFDELLTTLGIPLTFSASEKLERLRSVNSHDLISAQGKMKLHEFRALSDGQFISKNMIASINSGDFARRMKARGMKLMNGECRDERHLYQAWRTPSPSYEAVVTRLCADYSENVVKQLMALRCGPEQRLPAGSKDWPDAFGRLYADMQVHGLERGFHRALVRGGLEPGKDLLRYRFDWRTKGTASSYPPEWGVTHATDMSIWFWGLDGGLTEEEKLILRPWNQAFSAFVQGDNPDWGTRNVQEMKRLRADGVTDVWLDDRWNDVQVWDAVNGQTGGGIISWIRSKL
ncbi:hypothetical protein DOTSEDRAFT_70625 [Dothistroma septosporum NZE10]|uniref:Carboxylic ester hydrolase n=1 Tax=Dothistroma septosporum (strain NZE10 / CBS 128990) TaxID=675120 RepID=N1PWU7_DOTSN|nr:hypothetical protein DOTSEDRAFT_70625 [Dothistroma septosporum NZE10]